MIPILGVVCVRSVRFQGGCGDDSPFCDCHLMCVVDMVVKPKVMVQDVPTIATELFCAEQYHSVLEIIDLNAFNKISAKYMRVFRRCYVKSISAVRN